MISCTADEWADYLSDLRTYQTEYIYGKHSVMYSRIAHGQNVGQNVGEVHYCENGDKFYFILGD